MIRFPRYVVPFLVAVFMLFGLTLQGCASLGGARHIATVSVVTSHGILALVQDTEKALVCGGATAPAPPACVSASAHQANAANLAKAWGYEGDIERIVRALPQGSAAPSQLATLLGQINVIIDNVVKAIPASAPKTTLIVNLTGGK